MFAKWICFFLIQYLFLNFKKMALEHKMFTHPWSLYCNVIRCCLQAQFKLFFPHKTPQWLFQTCLYVKVQCIYFIHMNTPMNTFCMSQWICFPHWIHGWGLLSFRDTPEATGKCVRVSLSYSLSASHMFASQQPERRRGRGWRRVLSPWCWWGDAFCAAVTAHVAWQVLAREPSSEPPSWASLSSRNLSTPTKQQQQQQQQRQRSHHVAWAWWCDSPVETTARPKKDALKSPQRKEDGKERQRLVGKAPLTTISPS